MKKRIRHYYAELIRNSNQGRISVSNLEMTTPYYPESVLAKSKFFGFYSLFYIFTLYFAFVYPALNYMKTGNFFQKALFKILEANLLCDIASILLFLALSFCFMELSRLTKAICKNLTKTKTKLVFIPLIGVLWSLYVGIGLFIVRNFHMYFTDKIFIVVMSWAFCIKTLSYIFDMHEIIEITEKFEVKRREKEKSERKLIQISEKESNEAQKTEKVEGEKDNIEEEMNKDEELLVEISLVKKSSNLLEENFIQKSKTKLIYLISPEIIFRKFVLNYDNTLTIHPIYVINKILVSLLCFLVNLIIIIEMIEPLCNKESLEKYKFIELFFRFIPPIFYVNICLYFMVLENILPAIAEITKMKSRIYYEDWWNAQTLYEFLDKWVLLINSFTQEYLTVLWKNKPLRETLHVAIILFLIYEIFSLSERSISLIPFFTLSVGILLSTYFLGGNTKILNNHMVHIIIFSFSPLMLTIEMKYNIFTGETYEI